MKLTHCSLVDCGPTRTQSRSVSWNASGSYLGLATSDSTVRVWTLDSGSPANHSHSSGGTTGGGAKEVVSLTGHAGPVRLVQFHPTADTILASVATDDGVGQWDVRNGKCTSMMTTTATKSAPLPAQPIVSLQWNPVDTHLLAVTTRDGTVTLYDVRHVKQPHTQIHSNLVTSSSIVETCIFDPTGRYLVAGCHTNAANSKSSSRNGMGHLAIWPVQKSQAAATAESFSYPAHAGPIYALAFAKTGCSNLLVSGGSDAMVGLWHVPTMTCRSTVTSRTKWIRSVAVAPHDARFVAIATEEDAIELVDATIAAAPLPDTDGTARNATAAPTSSIGKSTCAQSLGLASFGPRSRGGGGGAEDVAFHPGTSTSSSYLLACARTDAATPVTIMKLTMGP
jgi:WD40 repeat protein